MKPLGTFFGLVALFAAGCMTLPVTGSTEDGGEYFHGSATGYLSGGGTITLVSNKGAKIKGTFVYINSRQGEGTFRCEDGRTGPFTFVSTGTYGTGTGRIGNQHFTFTFGE
jgi:hypothetical protein